MPAKHALRRHAKSSCVRCSGCHCASRSEPVMLGASVVQRAARCFCKLGDFRRELELLWQARKLLEADVVKQLVVAPNAVEAAGLRRLHVCIRRTQISCTARVAFWCCWIWAARCWTANRTLEEPRKPLVLPLVLLSLSLETSS